MKSIYSNRQYTIYFLVIGIGIIFIARLFYLQIINDRYLIDAQRNAIRPVTKFPARGIIYDRYGKIMVYNEASYDVMIIPQHVHIPDTTEFCNMLNIDKETLIEQYTKARKHSKYKASIFIQQISKETYGYLQEMLYKFNGFFVQKRTLRKYPKPIAAHTFGYVGEVNQRILDKDPYYNSGDYIGITGLEKTYEQELRGEKGVELMTVDVFNRIQGSYKDGKYDTLAVIGKNLYTSLDMDLQEYGEKLMQNKLGSIVAIEPATGEILAIVSSPSYDPNLLVGRQRAKNYAALGKDPNKPIFNRALMASYPPGSTFKLVNALIYLHEGAFGLGHYISCHGGYTNRGVRVGCHDHPSPQSLIGSIQHSCNAYYCAGFNTLLNLPKYKNTEEAYQIWRNHVLSFGLGAKFKTDLAYELGGNIPSAKFYNRYYGRHRWKALTVISLAIGQGEVLTTPMQLANLTATIANRGFYYPPHLVKAIGQQKDKKKVPIKKQVTTIAPKHFIPVVEGMHKVMLEGTGARSRIDSVEICGKTGTAQNPHGKDHSIFIAFAPKHNPKIAIAVFVENSGFGATWAAPIASLMIEKYLKKEVKRLELEKRMFEGNLIK